MAEPGRWARLSEPLRGVVYVVGLGIAILLVAAALAAAMVWSMT